MLVQIYGITTAEDAALVNELRPDHAGVVLDEGIETWDSVDELTARSIAAVLPDVKVVVLSLSLDTGRVFRTVAALRPQIVHLARAAEGMTPTQITRLRQCLAPVELMLTVPVSGPESIELARRLEGCCDYLLLDTVDPRSGVVGATGLVHDWSLSCLIVEAVNVPVILGGGLGPENVAEAIRQVVPAGVDSETLTSKADDRRRKDPERVRRFIETARGVSSS